jgi:hypothetical protein
MKQPWSSGGPSRRPRSLRSRQTRRLWMGALIAAVIYALARAWLMVHYPGQ